MRANERKLGEKPLCNIDKIYLKKSSKLYEYFFKKLLEKY